MKRLYVDTETTGFPQREGTPLEECPHIVQLAALLVDDETGEMGSLNVLIRPDAWTIAEDVAAIHGITTERADACGIPIKVAMAVFSQLCRNAEEIVAHNIEFDLKLVAYELARLEAPNVAADLPKCCTMHATTELCQLPGKFPGKPKWPKLIEAHRHFFESEFDKAHDALADVRACQRIHHHLLENNLI